jgi:ATP-dependent exoDNAse (exonuclease V) beta subunit
VWWDPHLLALEAGSPFGLRRDDLIAKDGNPAAVEARLAAYERWRAGRAAAITRAAVPSIRVETATGRAADRDAASAGPDGADIELVDVSRVTGRPFGPRFGTLVHATLATVPLDADDARIRRIAETQGRVLLGFGEAVKEDVSAAVEVVSAALRHPLFDQVRAADAAGRCFREWPIIWQSPDGSLIEGTIDLAFEEDGRGEGGRGFVVLDFKTDRELDTDLDRYRRQLAIYCQALSALKRQPARGILMRI